MSNGRTGLGRLGWLALVGQVLLLLLTLSPPARASTVTDILAEAGAGNLTLEECAQLSQALTDVNFSAKWSEIGTALRVNWDDTTMSAWDRVSAIQAVAANLTAQQKPLMAAALYELCAAQGAVVKQLDAGGAEELTKLLYSLGEDAKVPDLLAGWVASSDAYKTRANADQLIQLARILQKGNSETIVQQRSKVAGTIWDKYLADGAPDVSKVTFAQRMRLLHGASFSLAPQQVANVGPRLIGWLKDSAILASAKVVDIRIAESLPVAFGVAAEYPEIAAAWVAASEQWRTSADEDLVTLALAVSAAKSGSAQQQKAKLPGLFVEKYFGTNPEQVPFVKAVYLSRRMFPILTLEQKKQVADKLAPLAGEAQAITTLAELAELLRQSDRAGKDKGYAEYAAALARVLKDGATVTYGHLMAMPLGTAQTRQTLANELTDANGTVRRQVAWVLSWANLIYDSLETWQRSLDQKIADDSIAGDKKAGWLLARADSETAHYGPGAVSPLAGQKWLNQALAAATSEAMKLQCVETLAIGYVQVQQAEKARSFLTGIADQFTAEDSRTRLAQLRQRVEQLDSQIWTQMRQANVAATQRAHDQHVAELRLRLEQARRVGNESEVRRYEALLANQ